MPPTRPWLRGTVARHLLVIFIGCAVVPIAVLTWISYEQVSDQLREQSQRRLHRASKATALEILARLQNLDAQLGGIAEEATSLADGATLPPAEAAAFDAIALQPASGATKSLVGSDIPIVSPAPEGWQHLHAGKALLTVVTEPDGAPQVLMSRLLPVTGETLVVARVRRDRLFDLSPENTLPSQAEYCVVGPSLQPLMCSLGDSVQLPADLRRAMADSASGQLDWRHGDTEYLARYWSLMLAPQFRTPAWTLVLAEPRRAVFAPTDRFRTTFAPAVLGCLLLVSFLSVRQIRLRLEPLDRLRQGTERIARGDFAVDLDVASGDEFEELATSFNAMANRLEQQFERLATMIEIDRAILATSDISQIVGALITRVRDLHPCESVLVLARNPETDDRLLRFLSERPGAMVQIDDREGFTASEQRELAAHHEMLAVDPRTSELPLAAKLAECGAGAATLLPLFAKGEVVGIIACGYPEEEARDADSLAFARQLADQAAMALTNALALEQNRVLAYYDGLTGLPNRLMFRERVEQALANADRREEELAVCMLDLDGFKRVNDTLGHDAGDRLLEAVARRLERKLRRGSLARLGGDEFTILIRDFVSVEDPARVAQEVLDELSRPFEIGGEEVFASASIGIAVHPVDGNDLDTLLRNADTAMYHAKEEGGERYRFFTPSMHSSALARLTLERDLRLAIERDQFEVYYQPIVDTETRAIVAAEALIRWRHPERGMVSPAEFIPLAEENGLIVSIGEWVLRTACAQNRSWQLEGLPHLSIAVNLSSRQIVGPSLLAAVRRAIEESGLYPHYLALEITESSLVDPEGVIRRTLESLRDFGVKLAIDDFGTGYSSLAYLKHFPFDHLKIDRAFLTDAVRSSDDAAIVRAIVAMAHSLKLHVVAEGVETEAQLALLRQEGCESAQGYLFSEALPADAFRKLLESIDEG